MINGNQGVSDTDYCRIDRTQALNPTLEQLYQTIENNDFELLESMLDDFQLVKLLRNKDSFLNFIHGLTKQTRDSFISEFKDHFLNTIELDISCPSQPISASLYQPNKNDLSRYTDSLSEETNTSHSPG